MKRRVAIIGAGIGEKHLDAYLSLPESYTVACICDLNEDRAQKLGAPHGIPVTTSLDAVLMRDDIDIIDICLPPHLHLSTSVDALKAGKHVICEKPLVTSLADADVLARAAQDADRAVFPVFQYRYGLGTAQVLALIDAGLAGTCFAGSLETHWDRDADYYAVDWRGTWAGEQGGALLGHAIHIHDLVTFLLGPVKRLYAETATRVNPIEVEDCASLTLAMESGATISSSVTLGAAGNTSRLRLMFEGFTVESDHAAYEPAKESWTFRARSPTTQAEIDAVLQSVSPPAFGFEGLLTEIAHHLEGKPARHPALADGRASIAFVTAAYSSAKTTQPVALPLSKDAQFYNGWQPDAAAT